MNDHHSCASISLLRNTFCLPMEHTGFSFPFFTSWFRYCFEQRNILHASVPLTYSCMKIFCRSASDNKRFSPNGYRSSADMRVWSFHSIPLPPGLTFIDANRSGSTRVIIPVWRSHDSGTQGQWPSLREMPPYNACEMSSSHFVRKEVFYMSKCKKYCGISWQHHSLAEQLPSRCL